MRSLLLVIAILGLAACKKSEKAADKAADKAAPVVAPAKDEGGAPRTAPPQMGSATQTAQPQPEGPPPAADGTKTEAMQIVEKVADEMCKCSDAECAQKVVSENSAAMAKMTGFTPSTVEEGDAIMMASKRMSECAAKIPM